MDVSVHIKEESASIIAGWMPGQNAEEFVLSAVIQGTKPGEICIRNDGLCIKNDEFCIYKNELCQRVG